MKTKKTVLHKKLPRSHIHKQNILSEEFLYKSIEIDICLEFNFKSIDRQLTDSSDLLRLA